MQEVTDAQEDRRLTEEYRTHDLKKRTWSNRWICIKMKNSASTLKFLVESLFKFFCFIRFDWWFTTCRFFWVTVKIKVENFDWWKCLLVVIRSLFCNFFGSLINTLLLFFSDIDFYSEWKGLVSQNYSQNQTPSSIQWYHNLTAHQLLCDGDLPLADWSSNYFPTFYSLMGSIEQITAILYFK